jgi:HSP20 family protein
MKIVRFNDPFAELSTLHSQLDDMFNEMFGKSGSSQLTSLPAMDIYNDNDKQLVAEISAHGFSKDDVQVNVHEGVLEIKGEKQQKEEEKDKKRTYMVRESSSSFYRRIALPRHADADKVDAHFEDGVLKVTVPFKELPSPKKIQIKSKNK